MARRWPSAAGVGSMGGRISPLPSWRSLSSLGGNVSPRNVTTALEVPVNRLRGGVHGQPMVLWRSGADSRADEPGPAPRAAVRDAEPARSAGLAGGAERLEGGGVGAGDH